MMTNPLLRLLDLWSRRYVLHRALPPPPATKPATVVTGASGGIGLATSRRFAQAGDTVVLVARRLDALEQAAAAIRRDFNRDAIVLAIDINQENSARQIEAALETRGLHVEVLVNNAGFGLSGRFAEMPAADIDALISCNITALTRLSRHFLPGMVARRSGGLINLASLAGLAPGPFQAQYYASKAYVVSLTRAIGFETRGRGVRVSAVAPGPVETAFHARMNANHSLYRYLVPAPAPERVAAAIYRGFRWHRRFIVPGLPAKVLSLALRLVPVVLVMPVVAWMLYPREGGTTDVGREAR
jgi:uncharacterized protein